MVSSSSAVDNPTKYMDEWRVDPSKSVPISQSNMLWLIFLGAFLIVVYNFFRKPPGLPPDFSGLTGFQLCALVYWSLAHEANSFDLWSETLPDTVERLRRKHGDIYSWRLGSLSLVVLSDYNLIKSVFSKAECSGRPWIFTLQCFTYFTGKGLIFSEGRPWQESRRFALRHLRDFGLGRRSLERVIRPEVASFLKDLEGRAGRPTEVNWNLNVAVLNVIWRLVADRRFDINDPEIIRFEKMIRVNLDIIKGAAVLLDIFPWLLYLAPKPCLYQETSIIEEHETSLDPKKPRDYIDCYLLEMRERHGDPNTAFKRDYMDLLVSIADLFGAGSETTSSTLRWVVLYMALHPDVQAKVQAEIDGVVAKGTLPSLADRAKLPYTEATIMETLRMSSLVPRGIFHCNSDGDEQIAGYNIPKGSLLVPDMEKCHRDPQYWEKPDQFYPEHFLDEDNQVITKKDGFLPFCVGRRQCLGESLARMELFLFTSALLKKFCITPPAGVKLSTETNKHRPAFNFAKPFQCQSDTLVEYIAASILRESICQCADAIKSAYMSSYFKIYWRRPCLDYTLDFLRRNTHIATTRYLSVTQFSMNKLVRQEASYRGLETMRASPLKTWRVLQDLRTCNEGQPMLNVQQHYTNQENSAEMNPGFYTADLFISIALKDSETSKPPEMKHLIRSFPR
ncbi:cytochrome P450 2L1-like [Penaeus monodon]|uniref:cytochrome P450 2L1-like n=1 Tax=Penaeus monodon TaxID=6687 RepID=UPI0018A7CC5C|nr:cytochrome P450 2L1-like [Penaeus monodon]